MVARPFEPAETLKLSVKTALELLSTLTVFAAAEVLMPLAVARREASCEATVASVSVDCTV